MKTDNLANGARSQHAAEPELVFTPPGLLENVIRDYTGQCPVYKVPDDSRETIGPKERLLQAVAEIIAEVGQHSGGKEPSSGRVLFILTRNMARLEGMWQDCRQLRGDPKVTMHVFVSQIVGKTSLRAWMADSLSEPDCSRDNVFAGLCETTLKVVDSEPGGLTSYIGLGIKRRKVQCR